MKEPGLDDRHRNQDGRIREKNGNTINKNLPEPIAGFSKLAKLSTMREKTGQASVEAVREAAKRLRGK